MRRYRIVKLPTSALTQIKQQQLASFGSQVVIEELPKYGGFVCITAVHQQSD